MISRVKLLSWRGMMVGGVVIMVLVGGLLVTDSVLGTETRDDNFEGQRAKLVGFVMREELTRHHYTHKPLNDALSVAAFDLFLKQLDGQKRFLLQKDVARLRHYATRVDDEINSGLIELPAVAAETLAQRLPQVRETVKQLLALPIDAKAREALETDPDKLEFCADEQQLRERWRLILKYQVLTRYLNLLEEQKDKPKQEVRSETELLQEARTKIAKNYEQFFSRMADEQPIDRYDRYFNSITRAFDPHTNYLPPTQKEDFDISMRGSLEGIGATLREEDGYIKVVQIIPGSAAWRQGKLQAEDTILKVGEGGAEPVDITDMRLREAVSLIRGKKGTEVRLTVKKPDGAVLNIPIVRDVVQIEETFVRGVVVPDPSDGRPYGYVKIPSFYRDFQGESGRNVTDDTRRELERLAAQKIEGLIVDLRNNGGGALTDAVAIAGLFIDQGPVVQVRSGTGKTQVLEDEEAGVVYSGPLVVLVNQFSASASEILAAALQDYRRAVIVGSAHTHGKGTVQAMVDLDRAVSLRNMDQFKPLGALKVTIQKFYRVSGGSTQFRGVVPDIVLPDRLGHLKSGEQYIEFALPWDTVPATPIRAWNSPVPEPGGLVARSRQRVDSDPAWRELIRDAQLARERSEKTMQSLLLEDLRRERTEERKLAAKGEGFSHGEDDETAPPRKSALTAQERERQMIEETAKDPVSREAMAILADLVGGKGAPLASAAGQAGRSRPAAP